MVGSSNGSAYCSSYMTSRVFKVRMCKFVGDKLVGPNPLRPCGGEIECEVTGRRQRSHSRRIEDSQTQGVGSTSERHYAGENKTNCPFDHAIVSSPDIIFRARPAALSKNRVWTHSLVKAERNQYRHVVAPIRLLK